MAPPGTFSSGYSGLIELSCSDNVTSVAWLMGGAPWHREGKLMVSYGDIMGIFSYGDIMGYTIYMGYFIWGYFMGFSMNFNEIHEI